MLDCKEGHRLPGKELNAPEVVAAELIDRLRSLKDHRELGHELELRANIHEQDGIRMLARSISSLPCEPLRCVKEMISAVLDGKQVQHGTRLS